MNCGIVGYKYGAIHYKLAYIVVGANCSKSQLPRLLQAQSYFFIYYILLPGLPILIQEMWCDIAID